LKRAIFGIGTVSEAIVEMFSNQIKFDLAVVDAEFYKHSTWLGIPVLTYEEYVKQIVLGEDQFVVGVGYGNSNLQRKEVFSRLVSAGAIPMNLIHESSFVASTAILESGVLIFPFACVENSVTIKEGTIIWSNSLIGHNSSVGEFCFLAGSVTIGGSVSIENYCVVGIGASIGNNVEIGSKAIIGGGAIVMKHVTKSSVIINPSSPALGLPSEYFEKLGGFDHLKKTNQ
jgi:sugar O-acyltransferase (sialic acid O-acetyltransferase NeuD family)